LQKILNENTVTISIIHMYCVTWQGQKILFPPKRWDQLWGPPSPLLNGHQQLFHRRCSNSGINTNLHSSTCLYVMQWQPDPYLTYTVKMVNFIFMLLCIGTDFLLITNWMHWLSKFILPKNSSFFGQLLCPSPGVLYWTIGTGKYLAGFDKHLQAESGWTSMEFHPDSACWWAKKLPEKWRVFWQNKFG
jgi:hypothetical protein